MAATGIN